jgi:hypothetical protein
MTDFPGLIRFVFFKGIKNAHPLRSAPSRQVCISFNPAKRVAMERRRKSRSRRPRVKAPACAPSDPALMVIVVYHSCRQKSSEKCRGVRSSGWGKKAEGAISALAPRGSCSPPSQAVISSLTRSLTHLNLTGGYDVPFQFNSPGLFASLIPAAYNGAFAHMALRHAGGFPSVEASGHLT